MTLHERMKYARMSVGVSQQEMANRLQIALRTWQSYERANGPVPGGEIVARLVDMGFNANWILCGLGQMYRNKGEAPDQSQALSAENKEFFVLRKNPDQPSLASANMAFHISWLKERMGGNADDLMLHQIKCDEMSPTLNDGDIVVVNVSLVAIDRNGLFALRLGERVVVRRIQMLATGDVLIICDNGSYRADTVSGVLVNTINVVGRVVWVGKRL